MEAWGVLERAADKIERDGWTRHAFRRKDGSCCILGAIICVAPDGMKITDGAMTSVLRECDEAFITATGRGAMAWNDLYAEDSSDAVSMMRAVAASLKAARTEATRQHAPESTVAEVATGDAGALEHVS